MKWKMLFLITYWIRGDEFNIVTFLIDIYIIFGVVAIIAYNIPKIL